MMPAMPFTPDELRRVGLPAQYDYLTRRGWVRTPTPVRHSVRFECRDLVLDDGRPVEFFVADAEHYVDYPHGVEAFIRAMSTLYGVSPQAVYDELTAGRAAATTAAGPGGVGGKVTRSASPRG